MTKCFFRLRSRNVVERSGALIDKLELRVPRGTPFNPGLARWFRDTEGTKDSPWTRGREYSGRADLRRFGVPAIVHDTCTMDHEGNSKLELLDTGAVGIRKMRDTVEQVYDCKPAALAVMRIDLAADVPDLSPEWFLEHARVKWKRWIADIGRIEKSWMASKMGRYRVETVYWGKRPNCHRVYDKIECWRKERAMLERRERRLAHNEERAPRPVPTFAQLFGHDSAEVLTRCERQIGGGRVPAALEQFGMVRKNVLGFDPFSNWQIVLGGVEPTIKRCGGITAYVKVLGLRTWIAREGYARVYGQINQVDRNAKRILDPVERAGYLVRSSGTLTTSELRERFVESVKRQLAA